MNSPLSKTLHLLANIASLGIKVIIIVSLIELALTLIACGVGLAVWIAKDFLSGLAAGLATFVIGQIIVLFFIEIWDIFPEPSEKSQADKPK